MGFLDNSGDIILDAVLTDVGRKRMAEGEFKIAKFALGDDEIDYSLYNANHPSGSAYYDLEILQAPVMEAATKLASSIKYGLLSITRTDLVYMPVLELNQKSGIDSVLKHNNVILLAANKATYTTLVNDTNIGFSKVLEPNSKTPKAKVIIESGINSSDRQPTRENRDNMIINTNLLDLQFDVNFDSRFVGGILSVRPGQNQSFANNTDGSSNITLTAFAGKSAVSAARFLDNYVTALADGLEDLILQYTTATTGDSGTNLSELAGPRGGMTALSFVPSTEINAQGVSSPSYYTLYGSTGVAAATLGFSSGTYDFIDTTIYVQGLTTGASIQLPVRIVRQQA
jgi:hypothetical protein|tara:strand:- start:2639 stop:3664 length:1026 start_codon:yes stop_codon:yes gene_type:complete